MIATSHLFRPLGAELVALLRQLGAADWAQPTSAAEWSVKDVAAHLLDGDLRRLSAQRDGHLESPTEPIASDAELVRFLEGLNRTWVEAARRLSSRVLTEELEAATARIADLFEAADPLAPATFPVAWAGESESRMWLDIAREYTERWHHQDQIREAVGVPPLAEPRWLRPVLEASLLALPHAFRGVAAPAGTSVLLEVQGGSGGAWTLQQDEGWRLMRGHGAAPVCAITTSDLMLCRLLLHRLAPAEAAGAMRATGDTTFLAPLLAARAVMVDATP